MGSQDNSATNHPFQLVKTRLGAVSILNTEVGEIMHNPVGPWPEANSLYVQPSKFEEKIAALQSHPLVLFDVGLGAGSNALAVLHKALGAQRPFHMFSFERDLRLLRFAYEHRQHFPFFAGYEEAVLSVMKTGFWQNANVKWQLFTGDFLQTIHQVPEKAEIVFYDPYSSKKNPEMWTEDCFIKLYKHCSKSAVLQNYSQATPVRAAMLAAGFFVGYGVATGEKKSTTQAATQIQNLDSPLGQRWLMRWRRSDRALPEGHLDPQDFKEKIEKHGQFQFAEDSSSKKPI